MSAVTCGDYHAMRASGAAAACERMRGVREFLTVRAGFGESRADFGQTVARVSKRGGIVVARGPGVWVKFCDFFNEDDSPGSLHWFGNSPGLWLGLWRFVASDNDVLFTEEDGIMRAVRALVALDTLAIMAEAGRRR